MAKILAFLITMFAVAGLLAAFLFTRVRAFSYCIGLMDNRFTGLYTNPNIAAYVSVVRLVCIHLMYGKSRDGAEKRKLPRWFLNLGIAVNVLTVLLFRLQRLDGVPAGIRHGLFAHPECTRKKWKLPKEKSW